MTEPRKDGLGVGTCIKLALENAGMTYKVSVACLHSAPPLSEKKTSIGSGDVEKSTVAGCESMRLKRWNLFVATGCQLHQRSRHLHTCR
jgi:hypothetical protein